MQTTTHYALKKPDGNDTYDKSSNDNANMDTIDAQMYANAQAASAAQTAANNAQTTANAAIPSSQKGQANGVPTLDGNGKVTSTQLPSMNFVQEDANGNAIVRGRKLPSAIRYWANR